MKSVAKVAAPPTESKAPGKASCTGRPARLPRDARWGQSPAPLPAAAPGMAGNSAAPAARGRSDTFFPVEKRDLAEGAESQGCVLARGGWEVDGCRLQIRHVVCAIFWKAVWIGWVGLSSQEKLECDSPLVPK